uniref:PSP proline-rich domain-containing protein n=1 Tax=Lotharella oceanica TaxID=641309 RepID=A0A7S2TFR7_9EUKA|mmetsp:Transcript_1196/g.2303  ORF Transcript_1196/g.2303 Transcript_1196/m.2303 type:complete len:576 (+) Transcript_1196:79-1806(+)
MATEEKANKVKQNGVSKRAQRRARKKAQKRKLKHEEKKIIEKLKKLKEMDEAKKDQKEEGKVEFVAGEDDLTKISESAPEYSEFKEIFSKFSTPQDLMKTDDTKKKGEGGKKTEEETGAEDAAAAMEQEMANKKLSAKQRRRLGRLSIAELKQLVPRPDVVGLHDCNSHDPKLLVHLKSYRNTVPVPGHWCQKRKYLQGKRGLERSAFELPQFIADTGIQEVRSTGETDAKGLKASQKERMQPKMGKIDIDYQVLHDAFFRHQTKPNCTDHGDLYYEGKEYEVRFSKVTPTEYSDELLRALGMETRQDPPPWLFNMQRFGPPPSYPNLKFPGVNAPIPPGASYGFSEKQWGKAPVDAYNRPLYGDVYGTQTEDVDYPVDEEFKDTWGKVEDEEEEEESEEDEEDDEEEEPEVEDDSMMETSDSDMKSGIESVSSLSSGMETPETLQLRKKDGTGTETPDTVQPQKQLYTVLEEKKTSAGGQLFGTSHTYVLPTETSQAERRAREQKKLKQGAVEVALNPEEIANMSAETLKNKYQQEVEKEKDARSASREDVSDVIAEETRKRKQRSKKKSKFKF